MAGLWQLLPGRLRAFVPAGLWGLLFLLFLLPFTVVSATCSGATLVERPLTGANVATGHDFNPDVNQAATNSSDGFGTPTQTREQAQIEATPGYADRLRLDPNPLILVAWLLPLFGIVVVLLGGRLEARLLGLASLCIGGLGFLLLLIFPAQFPSTLDNARELTRANPFVQIHTSLAYGFWLALAVFPLSGLVSFMFFREFERSDRSPVISGAPPGGPAPESPPPR